MVRKGFKDVSRLGDSMCGIRDLERESVERVSRDERSSHSISSGILPALGVHSSRKIKLRRSIISPLDTRYRAWETFLAVLVFYTAWVSPFEFGFDIGLHGAIAITDNVVNGFFAIDIILTFFVAYLDKATYLLIDNQKLIALRYAKTWLIFDVISTIPTELVRKILPSDIASYGYFGMLRLWRLRRVSAMFQRWEKDIHYSYFLVRSAKLTCVVLFVVHCAGCFFYLLADRYPDPKKTWIGSSIENFKEEPLWDRYVTSIYWSIVTATTTGYGDFHPVNTGEMRETIQAASSFAKRNQLPPRLEDQMLAHLSLRHRTDSEGLQQQETLDVLPKAIRSSISHFLFYSLVEKVFLFQGVSNDLLFQLVSEMKAEYFPPREDIILQNEAPTDLYILVNGAVELISHRNGLGQVVGDCKTGDVCGEVGLLCYKPQLFTVRTKRLSQLLRLNRTAFLNILQANVEDGTIIMNNLLQHLKEHQDPVMQAIYTDTEHMLGHGKMDVPLSLCFAAAREDDLLMHHLLRRGSDPNELDNNGRSALHIAASKGSLECVLLLLDYGSDPNARDSEGNVPLRDALLGKHKSVIKVLVDNGATLSSGDVGQFACFAAEQNNIDLLKEIIKFGGDVAVLNSMGTTALHTAISEGNTEVVKFLIEQGADIDKPDVHGWTPRALADYQGHEEINALFQTTQEFDNRNTQRRTWALTPEVQEAPYLKKYSSEPTMPRPDFGDRTPNARETGVSDSNSRRRASNFQNSLAGIIAAGHRKNEGGKALLPPQSDLAVRHNRARVNLSCYGRGDVEGKVLLLPGSVQELLDMGYQMFGFHPTKVVTVDGAVIEDVAVVRDGDNLYLAS